jgi:hypothetical protein
VQVAQLAKEFNLSFAVWLLIHASIQQELNTWKCSEMMRQVTLKGKKWMSEQAQSRKSKGQRGWQ